MMNKQFKNLGMAKAIHSEAMMQKLLEDPNGKQKEIALALLKNAGISIKLKSYNLLHLKKIQRELNRQCPGQYRIAVFLAKNMFKLVYKGKKRAEHTIALLLHGKHFDLITSTKKLFQVLSFILKL